MERTKPYFDQPSKLNEMQLIIAREYGFRSWATLKQHIELREEVSVARAEMKKTMDTANEATRKLQERLAATLPKEQVELIRNPEKISEPGVDVPIPAERLLYCSFCGKSQHEVRKLIGAGGEAHGTSIAGPSVFICNECVDLCVQIKNEEEPTPGGKP